jgi:4-hydroxy-tetrahydrodipicolinate synthase
LFQHFLEVSRATKLPLVLYSVPSRCGVEIGVETVRRLAGATPRVVGIKEAGGNADRVSQLRAALGPQFSIFSGDDALTLPFMSLGAHGVVSVASNIVPRQSRAWWRPSAQETVRRAQDTRAALPGLQRLVHRDPTRCRSKPRLAMMGLIQEEFRLPLVPMSAKNRAVLKATLLQCGVLRHD